MIIKDLMKKLRRSRKKIKEARDDLEDLYIETGNIAKEIFPGLAPEEESPWKGKRKRLK